MHGDPEQVLEVAGIQTLEELSRGFTTLAGTRTQVSLTRAAAALPVRDGRQPALPKSTLSDLLGGKAVPSRDTVVTFLTVCGLRPGQEQQPWLAAWERVSTAHLRRPNGAVRVREARARLLGVHAAIHPDPDHPTRRPCNEPSPAVGDSGQDELPVYVPRDLDVDLRTKLTVARERGGFVLLTGDSSVGKTRALFQALRDVVPEWWLLHPADAPAVGEFAAAPTDRTVVWLDELQNYLDHHTGLPATAIARLISAGSVVVATLWPGEYATRAAPRTAGQPDRYANDRQLLGLADIVAVPGEFSTAERRRAEKLAETDRRIRIALDTPDAGLTQVMAAGPQLIQHWEQAPAEQCYGKAIITAALDARRVGARAPVTRAYLEAAAPGYLEPPAQATAPLDWLDRALDYATQPLHGAATALTPIPAGMGRIVGYQVADYLHQHAQRVRRTIHLPDTAWHALVDHHHPDDTMHLADNAERRGRAHEARLLYQQAADAGNADAAERLNPSVVDAEIVDEGQPSHRDLIRDDPDEDLAARADAGDQTAADILAARLAEQGREEELTQRADAGDESAAGQLAGLLAREGREEELRARADAGDLLAAMVLAQLEAAQGRVEKLQARADAGDMIASTRLAQLLAVQGRVEELTARADAGDWPAEISLANLLAWEGREEELQARADAGDPSAMLRLAQLLVEQERVEQAIAVLRPYTVAGSSTASWQMVELMADLGWLDELEGEVAAGSPGAVAALRRAREQPRCDGLI